jgi:hypothetical protein
MTNFAAMIFVCFCALICSQNQNSGGMVICLFIGLLNLCVVAFKEHKS